MTSTQDLPVETKEIQLDWREGCTRKELIGKLITIIVELDDTGSLWVQLYSACRQQIAVQRTNSNETSRQFVHQPRLTKRTLGTISGDQYLPQLITLAAFLADLAGTSTPILKRDLRHELRSEGFTVATIERIWMDLALTIKEHPYRLGVTPDPHGQCAVPSGWEMTINVCHNIFRYSDSGLGCSETTIANIEAFDVPSLTVDINLRKKEPATGDIRAVFVLEHRNIKAH